MTWQSISEACKFILLLPLRALSYWIEQRRIEVWMEEHGLQEFLKHTEAARAYAEDNWATRLLDKYD